MSFRRSLAGLSLVIGVSAVLPVPSAAAGDGHFRAHYDASLWGLVLGRADLTSSIGDDAFSVSGTFASAGLARIFDKTDGTTRASGRVGDARTMPARYRLSYRSGKKKQETVIAFSGGAVAKTTNVPKLKTHDDTVPVAKGDLKGVADPLSALMIPEDEPDKVCNRTLKVFDGETRVDLVLKPAGKDDWFDSGAVTCRVGFVPVSGYRKNKSAIKFLRDRAKILVAFAPVGKTGIQSPVEASIGTEIGTVHIRARPVEDE